MPGDGGTVGGFNSDHVGDCDTQEGKWPEKFFYCGKSFGETRTFSLGMASLSSAQYLTLFLLSLCVSLRTLADVQILGGAPPYGNVDDAYCTGCGCSSYRKSHRK